MKALQCEMCGSQDMVKQDGMYVCQHCGTKYSVEEARKLMIEVLGEVKVKNAAHIDSLLNLAINSYESENYTQAEKFCDQIIIIDSNIYDAWKLKAEAIERQIDIDNRRILEVYNCIVMSYRVLDEKNKKEKLQEVLERLYTSMFGEVSFCLDKLVEQRPTEEIHDEIITTFNFCYDKLQKAYEEFNLDANTYLNKFMNDFISKCNDLCFISWKTVVAYNYFREDIDNYGANWNRKEEKTEFAHYRPDPDTARLFAKESIFLISLLENAEGLFNDSTESSLKKRIYLNLINILEIYPNQCYYFTDGQEYYSGKEYYCAGKMIDEEYIESEKFKCLDYKKTLYWEDHKKEKENLESEKSNVEQQMEELYKELENIPGKDEADRLNVQIESLVEEKNKISIFKAKERKAVQEKIDEIKAEYKKVMLKVNEAKNAIDIKLDVLKKKFDEIETELTKER